MTDINIRTARKKEAAVIAELFMLAWPVDEILKSNGITYEQLQNVKNMKIRLKNGRIM